MNRTLAIMLGVVGLLVALIVVLVASRPSIPERQERGQAAITAACEAINNATIDECTYHLPGSLLNATIAVSLHTESDADEVTNQVLTDALKAVLASAEASNSNTATIYVTVTDAAGTKHGPEELGFSSNPHLSEIKKRFG